MTESTEEIILASIATEEFKNQILPGIFGKNIITQVEKLVNDNLMRSSSNQYLGQGLWDYMSLSNGGFYLRLQGDQKMRISSPNGVSAECSSDTASIVANLVIFNHAAWAKDLNVELSYTFSKYYYSLRTYALCQPDYSTILDLTD